VAWAPHDLPVWKTASRSNQRKSRLQKASRASASRHAIERMNPAHYLESPYYEHWLHSCETLLVEGGAISRKELDARVANLEKEAK
jgi:Nitrile hydratase beta subunit